MKVVNLQNFDCQFRNDPDKSAVVGTDFGTSLLPARMEQRLDYFLSQGRICLNQLSCLRWSCLPYLTKQGFGYLWFESFCELKCSCFV